MVIWAVPVLAPAATTLPAFAQPDAGAVTLAAGGGGMTHGFADASGAIVTTADTVHPVVAFVNFSSKSCGAFCVPGTPPGPVQGWVWVNALMGMFGMTTLNDCDVTFAIVTGVVVLNRPPTVKLTNALPRGPTPGFCTTTVSELPGWGGVVVEVIEVITGLTAM